MPELSIVLPAFNEAKAIGKVVKEVKNAVVGIDCEIIVVDDGSKDRTAEVISNIPGVTAVSHPYNKGYGASLKTGIRLAKSDYVMIMDGDGQHDPRYIKKFFSMRKDYDMIVGARNKNTGLVRLPAKIAIGLFANYLSGKRIPDLNSGYRLIKTALAKEYLSVLPNKFSFTTTITLLSFDGGYSVHYESIRMKKRKTGKSTIHPINDTLNFILLIVRSTMLVNPLKVFIPVSALMGLFGIAFVLYGLKVYSSFPVSATVIFMAAIFTMFFGLIADQISLMRKEK